MYTIPLTKLVTDFKLTNLTPEIPIDKIEIAEMDVNRPALQLAGYFDYFDSSRLQIIGKVEHTYFEKIQPFLRRDIIERMFNYHIPAVVFCRDLEPYEEMLELARQTQTPILGTYLSTSDFMGEVIRYLKVELAPRITIHGTFVDVFGEGVLILGDSGVGKSEAALELIKRGHRLIADDAVEIRKVSAQTLFGKSPELIRYFIELRGIGIIDIREMFGVSSIKKTQTVDSVIKLQDWDKTANYDRLGLNETYYEILGNQIPCNCIPIRPGRNLAIIIESAAINNRQKKMGYNAAEELNKRVMKNIADKAEEQKKKKAENK